MPKYIFEYMFSQILFIIGSTLLGIGLHFFWEKETFFKNATKTVGRVAYYLDGSGSGPTNMVVSFASHKGDTLLRATQSVFWLQRPKIGSKISIWYRPFMVDVKGGTNPHASSFSITGLLIAGLGIWFLYRTKRKQLIMAEVAENGHIVYATFKELQKFWYAKRGKVWVYSVCATWIDPETEVEYHFFSDPSTEKPSLDALWANPIPVRIHPENPKYYIMDMKGL